MLDEVKIINQKPLVISDAPDEVIINEKDYGNGERPEDYLDSFTECIKENMDIIAALTIVCARPKELSREGLKKLRFALEEKGFTTQKLNAAIKAVTNKDVAADIISIIRRYALGSPLLNHDENAISTQFCACRREFSMRRE